MDANGNMGAESGERCGRGVIIWWRCGGSCWRSADEVGLPNRQEAIRDEIIPVLALLETTESHLGAGNVFLGVF